MVQTWLGRQFGSKFINKYSWPPRSPDLNPCDIFFMGSFKASRVQSTSKNIGRFESESRKRNKKNLSRDSKKCIFKFSKKM